jgi:predicted phage terminase large subunit-like protein
MSQANLLHALRPLAPKWSKYIPTHDPDTGKKFEPTPKQLGFLMLPHLEALYGGMAGVGKSIALLAGALQYADVPGYNAIIFRKSLTDANLGGAVLDRAMKWLDRPDVHFDQRYSKFRFPEGSSLTIGYLKNEGDHERYKSAEFQYIGFDEQTDFAENVFLFLISRLRRVTGMMQVPLRIRGATNPGGLGHVWVKQRYKIERDLATKKWMGRHPHRPFIAAYRADNPHIDLMSYEYNLSQLGTMDRLRMKEGDWSASESARFKEENFVNRWVRRGSYIHCPNLKKSWHFNTLEIFFTIDPAASSKDGVNNLIFRANREPSYSVASVWARTWDNHLLWLDQIRCQVEIPDILQLVLKAAKIYRPGKVIIEGNGVGKGVYQLLEFMGLPIHPVTTSVDKLANASCALTRCAAGKVLLPEDAPWIPTVFGEILVWTGHPAETADQVDALSNACIYVQDCAGFSEREYDTQPPSTPEIVGESWSNGISVPSDAWSNYAVPQLSYAG